jgi:shikimate dehydrogenase
MKRGFDITARTRLFLLVGHPVSWSLSPQIFNRVFEETGIDARYLSLDIAPGHFARVFPSLLDAGVAGNITAPYKEKALAFVTVPNEEALMTGACNVFWNEGSISRGDNTDIHGFLDALPASFRETLRGGGAVMLGAGGVARSIAVGLLLEGVGRLLILNRDEGRRRDLADSLSTVFPDREIRHADYDGLERHRDAEFPLLVNATSAGWRRGEAPPVDPGRIPGLRFCYDVVYGRRTALMEACTTLGVEVEGGLEMLIRQAALAFERWFGREAPVDIMRRCARRALDASADG